MHAERLSLPGNKYGNSTLLQWRKKLKGALKCVVVVSPWDALGLSQRETNFPKCSKKPALLKNKTMLTADFKWIAAGSWKCIVFGFSASIGNLDNKSGKTVCKKGGNSRIPCNCCESLNISQDYWRNQLNFKETSYSPKINLASVAFLSILFIYLHQISICLNPLPMEWDTRLLNQT